MSFTSSPYKSPHRNPSQSDLSLSALGSPSKSSIDSKHETTLAKIKQTKNEISILAQKTDVYSKNTTTNYRSITTPKKESKSMEYSKSPHGKELRITDYSTLV